jgi:hypothetical protein
MKKILILLLAAVVCFACKHREAALNPDIEIIDAGTELQESATNLFEQINVVALETTDSSLVGLYIKRTEIWNNKIFVLNAIQSHRNILCFDLSGKFLFKIDRMGQGPGEYTYLGDFIIDKHRDHLVTLNSPGFMHFDLQGNFLYKVTPDYSYYARNFIYLNDSTYLAYNDGGVETGVPKGTSLLYLDPKTMNVRDKSDRIPEYVYNTGSNHLSINNNRALCLSYNDSIYDVSDTANVHVSYFIDYGDAQAKLKGQLRRDLNLMTDYGQQIDFVGKFFTAHYYSGEIMSINTICENDKYLVLSCTRADEPTKTHIKYILFHDKISKKTYNSENIDFGGVKFLDCAINGDNESFYCILYSEFTEEDKNKIKNSPVFSEADKKKLIEYNPKEDNPLILVLK